MLLVDLIRSCNESTVLTSDFAVNVDSAVMKHIFFYYTFFTVLTGIFIGIFLTFMFAYIVGKNKNITDGNNKTNVIENNKATRIWNIPPESDIVD